MDLSKNQNQKIPSDEWKPAKVPGEVLLVILLIVIIGFIFFNCSCRENKSIPPSVSKTQKWSPNQYGKGTYDIKLTYLDGSKENFQGEYDFRPTIYTDNSLRNQEKLLRKNIRTFQITKVK